MQDRPLKRRLAEAVVRSPGRTASELAVLVIGREARASGVQFTLSLLELRGLISRSGDGGRADPFRYFPGGDKDQPSTSAPA